MNASLLCAHRQDAGQAPQEKAAAAAAAPDVVTLRAERCRAAEHAVQDRLDQLAKGAPDLPAQPQARSPPPVQAQIRIEKQSLPADKDHKACHTMLFAMLL